MQRFSIFVVCLVLLTICDCQTLVYTTSTIIFDTSTTTISVTTTATTDKEKFTINDDSETTTLYVTTVEQMNMITSNNSDVDSTIATTTTIITSQTRSTAIQTTTTYNFAMDQKADSITTLSVSLGLGIPALFITISGLFYHYRKGQLRTKALSSRTNPNEIPMTETNV